MLRLGGYSGERGSVREFESEGVALMRLKNELEGILWNHGPLFPFIKREATLYIGKQGDAGSKTF